MTLPCLAKMKGELQELTNNLEKTAKGISLRISTTESKVMHIGSDQDITTISIDKHNISGVDSFTCLLCLVANNGDVEDDVNYRIGKTGCSFPENAPNMVCKDDTLL